MRGCKKFFFMMISILLCSVLITSTAISGTLAKYARNDSGTTSASVAKWGVTVTTDTDVDAYEDGDTIYISSETGVIAPGTSGNLASFKVTGSPEVAVKLDFTGTMTIGDGFKLPAHRAAANQDLPIYIRDEIGRVIDYFPIAIYFYRYDTLSNGTVQSTCLIRHCAVRLTPDSPVGLAPGFSDSVPKDSSGSEKDVKYRMSFFDTTTTSDTPYSRRFASVDGMEENLSHKTHASSLNRGLDASLAVNTVINSEYVVKWCWAYDPTNADDTAGFVTDNFKKTRDDGTTVYTYQTRELDTQLGELIAQYPDLFNITLNMSLTVSQID